MKCKCDDGSHDLGTALWHRSWCHWYDHQLVGHDLRATVWGWLADRLVRFA